MKKTHQLMVLVLLAIVPTVILTGCGSAQPSQSRPSQEAAIRQVIASMRPSDLVAVRLGTGTNFITNRTAPWLYVTVRAHPQGGGRALESIWQADMLAGAVAELSRTHRRPNQDLGGWTVEAQDTDGFIRQIDRDDTGAATWAQGETFPGAGESDATIKKRIRRVAAAQGLTILTLRIFHADGPAPAVVVTGHNVRRTAEHGPLHDAFFSPSGRHRYPGFYYEITNERGVPIIRYSTANVLEVGRTWFSPGYRGGLS